MLSQLTLIIQINIIFILRFGYSYGYAINLVQTMYAANSKIVRGTAQSGHLPYLLNAQAAQTLWEFVGL